MNIKEEKFSFFREKLINQYGEELTSKIYEGYNVRRKTTFRINTLKSNSFEVENILKDSNIEFEKAEFIENAYILKDKTEKDLEKLEIYEEGKIYVQSLSSMLSPIVLNPRENADILDMTAAPGGKTTQIAMLVNNRANITACEINNIRVEKLKYNVQKQGASSVYIMQKDARIIDDFFKFDQILLDAPCSGSGTLNFEDKNIEKYFSLELVQKTIKLQASLLKKAVNIVKTGGEIVYSTCSILEEENEKILKEFLNKKILEIIPINFFEKASIPLLPTKIEGTLCILPNEIFEGFFIAKLRKI